MTRDKILNEYWDSNSFLIENYIIGSLDKNK